ncbi:MAG TPA: ADP-forming succinate--CoA ligase subunit beta [Chloroflexota bacterium]|nr:ADP-forming succinate--CoA ligase subunit beta [Chloroflexota bacterium]
MKLQEYVSKDLLRKAGVPVPHGQVAESVDQVEEIARRLGPVAVKAQVLVGGRGKAGGIKLADTPEDARQVAQQILGMDIKGLTVEKVLVEQQQKIAKEYYAGITLDRARRQFVLMLSSMGGVDIEEVAAEHPDAIIKVPIDPSFGLLAYQIRDAMFRADFDRGAFKGLQGILGGLWRVTQDKDAMLAEVNPLAVTDAGNAIAADAKIDIDDSALFRHPDLAQYEAESINDSVERYAAEHNVPYVKLDGNIGIIANGAGLAMMTMDAVRRLGGQPANFLDVSGGARAEVVRQAIQIVLMDPKVEGIVMNIFGGITRGDEVARGLLEAASTMDIKVPIAIRIAGTREAEGRKLLEDSPFTPEPSLDAAATTIIRQVHEKHAAPVGGQ